MIDILQDALSSANDKKLENRMFERFGDFFLEDSIRIISRGGNTTPLDAPLVNEALCILITLYTNKVRNGEINKNKVLH